MGYRHCGQLVLIYPWNKIAINPGWMEKMVSDGAGLFHAVTRGRDVLIRDHFINSYIAHLNRAEYA